jgi:hypothetical protein
LLEAALASLAALRQAQLIDQLPQPQATPATALQGSGTGCGAGPAADRRLDLATRHPDGHLDRLDVARPIQDGVGAASLTARTRSSNNLARDGGRQLLHAASGRHADARQGRSASGTRAFQLLPTGGVAAVLPCWGVLQARVVQLRHRAGLRAAWHQPSGAPWQRLPAGNVMARFVSDGAAFARSPDPPQPVQLRRQRPGAVLQVQQVAVAVERPPMDAARLAAGLTGLRGAWTGIIGPRPASASMGLAEPRAGRDGELPGPAGLPAAHEVSPPWPDCRAPTNPPRRWARPTRSRIAHPPYSPAVGLAGHGLGAAGGRKAQRPAHVHRGAPDRSVMSCQQGSG